MNSKIATICAFISLGLALLFAWFNPATGYELDIYASTPFITWVLIGASMLIGAGIILHQLFTKGYKHSRLWMLGFAVLIVSRLALLWVPYARNYLTWGGDNITHWGMIIDILNTGHLYAENSYPVTHSILAQVIQVTGLSIGTVSNLSTGLFSIFYIVVIYLLSTRITPKPKYHLMSVLLAGFIVVLGGYNVFLMPNGWSILFMPLLFYFLFSRTKEAAFSFPFMLVLILFPFFHPLSSLMAGLSLVVILTASVFFWYFTVKNTEFREISLDTGKPLTPAVIQFVILIPWILSFNRFKPNIRNMWAQITSGAPSQFGDIGDNLAKINMTGWDTVTLFFKLYGVTTFMITISLAGIILILIKIKKGKRTAKHAPLLMIGSLVVFFGLLYLLYLIGFPGMSSIGGQRMLSYVAIFTPLVGSYALIQLFKNFRFKAVPVSVTLLLVGAISFLGIRGVYASPYQLQPNGQITTQTMAGAEWFIETKNPAQQAACIMSPINRYADGILGRSEAASRADLKSSRIIRMEDHFGYNKHNTLGEQYSNALLLNITKKDKIIYDTVLKTVDRFRGEDFNLLKSDTSLSKTYNNSEFSIYHAYSKPKERASL